MSKQKKLSNFKRREFFAYEFLNQNKVKFQKNVKLNVLEKLLNKFPNNEFFVEMKINFILNIMWHFDYINNYLEDPKNLQHTIDQLYYTACIYNNFRKSNWINDNKISKKSLNRWDRTRHAFNYMWTRTTKKNSYNMSKKMVEPRVKQIISMFPGGSKWIKDKTILDSGCGPARYIDCISSYNPKSIHGLDSGADIIKQNKIKFKSRKKISFSVGNFKKLKFKNSSFDFIFSVGVLHHCEVPIKKLMDEHIRVLKNNGMFFVFIQSSGGLQLKLWKFFRSIMRSIDISYVESFLKNKINPLRIQGFLDHSYGELQPIKRIDFEKYLKKNFKIIKRVPGIQGADVTPEIYKKDKFYKQRFGDGNLRYLLTK
ncbi:class I SAM-dependent methyltransferase [Candidatus Pelagibacter communis]|uniref:class I SAM-dependent methyltransferase n=1 Tax=Pelagibacter ubique TaxID=198252 RepID=UPI003EDE9E18